MTMMSTDEELMHAYASGQDAALREIFDRYAPLLVRRIQAVVGRRADAQDLVQQTFLQLHRARRDFRTDMRLRPWIMTIALNLARDLLRRRSRRPESPIDEETLPAPVAVPDDTARAHEIDRQVRAALSGLRKEQREVIELHWFEALSFDEIAPLVGVSSGAARVRAHRGYVALRGRLGPARAGGADA